jgi:hypothetical protein
MFQTFTHIQRRRGRDGQSRQEYLQQLVDEYKKVDTPGSLGLYHVQSHLA